MCIFSPFRCATFTSVQLCFTQQTVERDAQICTGSSRDALLVRQHNERSLCCRLGVLPTTFKTITSEESIPGDHVFCIRVVVVGGGGGCCFFHSCCGVMYKHICEFMIVKLGAYRNACETVSLLFAVPNARSSSFILFCAACQGILAWLQHNINVRFACAYNIVYYRLGLRLLHLLCLQTLSASVCNIIAIGWMVSFCHRVGNTIRPTLCQCIANIFICLPRNCTDETLALAIHMSMSTQHKNPLRVNTNKHTMYNRVTNPIRLVSSNAVCCAIVQSRARTLERLKGLQVGFSDSPWTVLVAFSGRAKSPTA